MKIHLSLAALGLGLSVVLLPASPAPAADHTCLGQPATIAGNDSDLDETITGTEGNDVIWTGGGNDTIDALGGNDLICSGAGNDIITGGLGTNEFHPGLGGDVVTGNGTASGRMDTIHYEDAPSSVQVELPTDSAAGGDDIDHIKDIYRVVGSRYGDDITGDDSVNVAHGGPGNDIILLRGGDDQVFGGGGDDDIWGGAGEDLLYGDSGADTIAGDSGADTMYGTSPGKRGTQDTVSYFSRYGVTVDLAAGTVTGGQGNDRIHGFDNVIGSILGDDVITGNANRNTIWGKGGNDTIRGMGGNDLILPGRDNDRVSGGTGRDELSFADMTHPVEANLMLGRATDEDWDGARLDRYDGFESYSGSRYADRFLGTNTADVIDGAGGNDRITALVGNDRITGGSGNDALSGGDGNDTLRPGPGNDRLTGGSGSDWVSFAYARHGVRANLGRGAATGDGTDSLNSIENLEGSKFADRLTGSRAANRLNGMGGNDLLSGGPGNDRFHGGSGTDTCYGGTGTDRATACERRSSIP